MRVYLQEAWPIEVAVLIVGVFAVALFSGLLWYFRNALGFVDPPAAPRRKREAARR